MEQKTRIKGNVHYVGVNDRNKHLLRGCGRYHMGFRITLI